MPDGYEIALFLHIVGVAGLFGAAAAFWVAMMALRRLATAQECRSWATLAVWSDRAFPVSSLLVLAAGAYMVEDIWNWGDGWINTSLIALIIMGAGGGLLITPRVRRIDQALRTAADGAVSADVRSLVNDPVLWGTLHAFTLGMFAIVWNMTVKPGDAQAGTVVLLAFVLGAVSALPMAARER